LIDLVLLFASTASALRITDGNTLSAAVAAAARVGAVRKSRRLIALIYLFSELQIRPGSTFSSSIAEQTVLSAIAPLRWVE
jgi:hypothetical protein